MKSIKQLTSYFQRHGDAYVVVMMQTNAIPNGSDWVSIITKSIERAELVAAHIPPMYQARVERLSDFLKRGVK